MSCQTVNRRDAVRTVQSCVRRLQLCARRARPDRIAAPRGMRRTAICSTETGGSPSATRPTCRATSSSRAAATSSRPAKRRARRSPTSTTARWRPIDLPHDWAIELPFDPDGDKDLLDHGYHAIGPDHPQHSVGWYRRVVRPARDRRRPADLRSSSTASSATASSSSTATTSAATPAATRRSATTSPTSRTSAAANVVVVRVDASLFEGWWYEGAGIYRHVWLVKTDPLHVAPNGTFVTSKVGETAPRK